MLDLPLLSRAAACCGLALALVGCGDRPPAEPGPTPRPDDPALVHTWQLPADASVLWGADLGSEPPALADALMADATAPGILHRSATACARAGSLGSTTSLALRLTIVEGGVASALEGDPAGPAAACMAEAVRAELAEVRGLPAGAALMVLRFHSAPPR